MRKKVQRQLSRSVTRPPKVGPMIGPITPPTPHIMMMKGCWLRWNEDSRMVWPIGKIGAPNAPCTTRNASSPSSESTRPHSTEVSGEARHRAGHQRAPAQLGRQPAGEWRGDRGRHQVEGEDPGDLLLGGRERALELRQDHSDAGRGQAEQDGRELHRQQDQPLPAGERPHPAMLRAQLRRASCLRRMKRQSAVRYAAVPNCLAPYCQDSVTPAAAVFQRGARRSAWDQLTLENSAIRVGTLWSSSKAETAGQWWLDGGISR